MKKADVIQQPLQELDAETLRETGGGFILAVFAVYTGVVALAYGVGYLVGEIEQRIEESQEA